MEVPGVFGMWHFISTNALSFIVKKKAVGDISAALLPNISCVVFPPPLPVPGSQAGPGEPQLRVSNLLLGSVWGCWDTRSWKTGSSGWACGRLKGDLNTGPLRDCREQGQWALIRWCEFYPTGTSKWQVKIFHLGRGRERRLLLP